MDPVKICSLYRYGRRQPELEHKQTNQHTILYLLAAPQPQVNSEPLK